MKVLIYPELEHHSIYRAAAYYDQQLAGRSLLILYLDDTATVQTCSVSFDAENFMRLTGIYSTHGNPFCSKHFFYLALHHRLGYRDFAYHYDRSQARLQLVTVEAAVKNVMYADWIGTYNHSGPLLFTEPVFGKLSPCIGFIRDKRTGAYRPNTLVNLDLRRKFPEQHTAPSFGSRTGKRRTVIVFCIDFCVLD